ncbi:MAG TPA: ABC transporter permease [Bryobacteraceae bacterium]|nr:ABC transporter permease [Bryobacteraceae bacterium]
MESMFKGIWSDLIYAARSLAKARAFTFVCIVSLGIGMAPVIAVPYGARILRMPPPGVNTDGLVEVITTANESRGPANSWSYADFMDLRNSNTGIALIGWATAPSEITLPGGQKMAMWPMYVSSGYFKTLDVRLARGPGFEGQRFEGQADTAVILGYRFWQNELNADPDIIGRTLKLDKVPYVVAGIAPDGFQGHLGLQGRELFVPLERYPLLLADSNARFDRSKEWLHIHGRLSQGISVAQASAAVAGITARLAKEYPATNQFKTGIVEPYDPLGVLDHSRFQELQAVGLTLTGVLLLVVCLNLSGMMQVRSAMRERELSIRQAVGATRLRLARHLLAEAVLVAAAGGTLASLALFNAPTVISRLSGRPIPPQFQDALKIDFSMIAICIGLCLWTSLIFGFLPALRFSRPVIVTALKDDAGAGGLRVGRVHRFTAALQVAIAVPLLVLGGISLDRVRSTATADLGFASGLLYAAPLDLDAGPETAAMDFRIRSLRDNLGKASGIASVTVADGLPLDFRDRPATVSLQTETNVAPPLARVQTTRVGDGYLNTMNIPLLSGRNFSGHDSAGSEKVTLISKSLADRLFPNAGVAEPIGKRLTFTAAGGSAGSGIADTPPPQTLTIIGVTADFPTSQMSADRAQLLLPLAQNNRRNSVLTDDASNRIPNLLLIARSAPGEQPEKIAAALENVVRELDPEFRRDRIVTGTSLRRKSMDDFLTQSAVAGAAGGVVLMLSALGIYGVVGLMVAARTREIAVRIALGASRWRVIGMILFDVVKLTAPGVGVGLILTAALVRLNPERFGIPLSNAETLAYAAGAAIAILVAAVASLAPARRAASVPPMVAMRTE